MVKKLMKKLSFLTFLVLILPLHNANADIIQYIRVEPTTIDEFTNRATKLKQNDALPLTSKVYLDNPLNTVYSGIGRVFNDSKYVDGTGFVIDDYTYLTSTHVVDNNDASKRYEQPDVTKIKFQPAVQHGKVHYTFTAKDIKFITNTDIAIVHTTQKITNDKIRPIKLATPEEVNALKIGDKIHIAGYPKNNENTLMNDMYWSTGVYLGRAENKLVDNNGNLISNTQTMVTLQSALTEYGSSGSPVMNKNYRVFGVHSASWGNNDPGSVQLTGGGLIDGYIRTKILENMK